MEKARAARVPHAARRIGANGRIVAPPISSALAISEGICGIGIGIWIGSMTGRTKGMSTLGARMTAGCTMLLLIAAAPAESARVGHVIDGDTFRAANGSALPGSTHPPLSKIPSA